MFANDSSMGGGPVNGWVDVCVCVNGGVATSQGMCVCWSALSEWHNVELGVWCSFFFVFQQQLFFFI